MYSNKKIFQSLNWSLKTNFLVVSDLHTVKNEWGSTTYPIVPGHEIVDIVTKVGNKVKNFHVGDKFGIGVIVDSCQTCENCQQDLESYCPKLVYAYNSPYKGTRIQGGYSNFVVVHQKYVLQFPENLPLDVGAPLLCVGITVYSPMIYYGMTEPCKHLRVVGLGGLGHVAIKFGKVFGLKVTVINTSPDKEREAIDKLGVDAFLVSKDPQKLKAAMGTMDYIIDTISVVHPLLHLLDLLKLNGKLVPVGLPNKPIELIVLSN